MSILLVIPYIGKFLLCKIVYWEIFVVQRFRALFFRNNISIIQGTHDTFFNEDIWEQD